MFTTNYLQTHKGIELTFARKQVKLFGLQTKIEKIDLKEWSKATKSAATLALAEIYQSSDIYPDDFFENEGTVVFGWKLLANLSNNTLKALGLPENPPHNFSLTMDGSLISKKFSIKPVWGNINNPKRVSRNGAMLEEKGSGAKFIIPDPIFTIQETIDEYNTSERNEVSDRMALCAKIISLVNPEKLNIEDYTKSEDASIMLQGALKKLTVKTARSLSVNVTQRPDGFHCSPVLFGSLDTNSNIVPSEKQSLLSERERNEFEYNKNSGYLNSNEAKRTYLLGDGQYLLIDDNLYPALKHVKKISQSSEEERKEFARNPAKAFTDIYRKFLSNKQLSGLDATIEEEQIEALVETVFIETPEFSERVTGLGLWAPPVLPYIKQVENSWIPEEFGLFFGETFIPLAPEDINPLKEEIKRALDEGLKETTFNGKKIPISDETLKAVQAIQGIIQPQGPSGKPPEDPTQPEVLLIKENFDDLTFEKQLQKRKRFEQSSITNKISSDLMPHQEDSLNWQINAYLAGLPGILNADDQGLGKTLQTIAFLSWLQENMRNGPNKAKKPILVVAPTSLLRNWGNEVIQHMTSEFGLGSKIDAFGVSLKSLKRKNENGEIILDLGVGEEVQPDSRLCWILTTYTTLKEHQIEFAKIDFGAVIFDEIQAIKNVSTLSHRAAASLKSDFSIGLTGTPVENAISDLWAIIDILSPGYLGSLKDFVGKYNDSSIDEYKFLNKRLFEQSYDSRDKKTPPLAIRRMKSDTIANLPQKNYRLHTEIMPQQQEVAYDSALVELASAGRGSVLKVLHRLRGISLYPGLISQMNNEENALSTLRNASARFKSTLDILDKIKDRNEKALIFLENHEMQYALRSLLEQQYNLPEVPIINGQVMPIRRGKIVENFQNKMGDGQFDLLILSPKAAGVGLTLTAATNIIHVSRWWNPAIEEQCNDRIYRIGQREDVTIHVPISVHSKHQTQSFDCILNNIMLRKRKLFREILMPAENLSKDQNTIFDELKGISDFDISYIDSLDWKAFEHWTGTRASELGDWEVSNTPRTGDGGLDIYMKHVERKNVVLVQCKHTTRDEKFLGTGPIHEILHAAQRYDTGKNYQSVVITNAHGFVKEAMELALENNIILIDRQRLALWPAHIV